MSIIDRPAPAVQPITLPCDVDTSDHGVPDAPSDADYAAYLAMISEAGEPGHDDGETPAECRREPWASWPEWTDGRWTLADAEAEAAWHDTIPGGAGSRSSAMRVDADEDARACGLA